MLPFIYNSQIDKKIALAGYMVINTEEDFDSWYQSIQYQSSHSRESYIYRGMCEAAFKNHTSVQRKLFERYFRLGDTRPYVEAQIKELRAASNHLIDKYAESLGIICSDLFVLSFAQHYGGLSPMIDFTTDLNTALYFMCCEPKTKVDIPNNLCDYSSIYWCAKSEFTSVENLLKIIGDVHKPSADVRHEVLQGSITKVCNVLVNYRVLSHLVKHPVLIENKKYPIEVGKQVFNAPVSISNLNITAQSGCFVYYDPEIPLAMERPLSCVEINKKLIPHIKSTYLKDITKELLFPLGESIVKESMESALRMIENINS